MTGETSTIMDIMMTTTNSEEQKTLKKLLKCSKFQEKHSMTITMLSEKQPNTVSTSMKTNTKK